MSWYRAIEPQCHRRVGANECANEKADMDPLRYSVGNLPTLADLAASTAERIALANSERFARCLAGVSGSERRLRPAGSR
jgi:hypothetical protein